MEIHTRFPYASILCVSKALFYREQFFYLISHKNHPSRTFSHNISTRVFGPKIWKAAVCSHLFLCRVLNMSLSAVCNCWVLTDISLSYFFRINSREGQILLLLGFGGLSFVLVLGVCRIGILESGQSSLCRSNCELFFIFMNWEQLQRYFHFNGFSSILFQPPSPEPVLLSYFCFLFRAEPLLRLTLGKSCCTDKYLVFPVVKLRIS